MICVYCKKQAPLPKKGEHIVLAGLGGRATIDDVCSPCNQKFGDSLDREFLRSTLIALDRMLDPEVLSGEGPGPQFVKTEQGYLDARILNSGRCEVLRQIVRVDDAVSLLSFTNDARDLNQLVADFRSRLARARVSIRDVDEHEPPRVVARPDGRGCVVRARNDNDARQLIERLQSEATTVGRWVPRSCALPSIKLSMEVNIPGRCAAKMAFNMATAILGADTMLSPAFDPVRDYILGTTVQRGEGITEEGESGPIVDTRFVAPWWLDRAHHRQVPTAKWHRIVLFSADVTIGARLTLRSGLQEFTVGLASCPGAKWPNQRLATLWSRASDDWWIVGRQPPRRFGTSPYGRHARG